MGRPPRRQTRRRDRTVILTLSRGRGSRATGLQRCASRHTPRSAHATRSALPSSLPRQFATDTSSTKAPGTQCPLPTRTPSQPCSATWVSTPKPRSRRRSASVSRSGGPQPTADPVIDQLCDKVLLNLSSSDRDARPEGITASLYPYQLRGWQWLRFIISEQAGGLLADEMGLGKTLQIISALRDPGTSTSTGGSLVVAPGFPPRKLGSGDREVLPRPTFHQASRPRAHGQSSPNYVKLTWSSHRTRPQSATFLCSG